MLVLNKLNNNLPEAFKEFFKLTNNHHNHNTRDAIKKKISLPQVQTTRYGLNSIEYKSAKDWNDIQQKVTNFNYEDNYLSKSKFIKALKSYFLQTPQ